MAKPPDFRKLSKELKKFWEQVPTIAGAKAVAYFKESFRRQGWAENGSLKPWKKRAIAEKGRRRAILIKSGRLRRSIRIIKKTKDFVVVGTDVPYAQIHNEGGTISETVRVPAFRRKAHKVKGHKNRGRKIKAHRRKAAKVKSHSREINITLPRRQFIGQSPDVMKSVERELFRKIDTIFNNI